MDALPIYEETGLPFASERDGKMHACGHDGHTSMLVGAARPLSQDHLRARLNGTVKFIFQPAEEGGGGGRVMVEEGVAEDVRSIFALHLWPGLPFGTAATKDGPIMAAADAFEMMVKGSGGHGAMPHLTVDAVAELIDRLLARLSRSRLKPFIRLGRTIRKHRDGILAARRLNLSNARAEALNNRVKLIVRKDADIAGLGDLADKTMVFGSCDAADATVLPVYFLKKEGVSFDRVKMMSTTPTITTATSLKAPTRRASSPAMHC